MASTNQRSVADCLAALGVTPADLAAHVAASKTAASPLDAEFKLLKRSYFARILEAHPDKGGDPEVFRTLQESFEVLRGLYQSKSLASFGTAAAEDATAASSSSVPSYHPSDGAGVPSYEFYRQAAEASDLPGYRIEPARSGRSRCVRCQEEHHPKTKPRAANHPPPPRFADPKIPKGSLRAGSLDPVSGRYARWHRLSCWRVPSRIWLGLDGLFVAEFVPLKHPGGKGHYRSAQSRSSSTDGRDPREDNRGNEPANQEASVCTKHETDPETIRIARSALARMEGVVLCGFADLSEAERHAVAEHVCEPGHHARLAAKRCHDHATTTIGPDNEAGVARMRDAPNQDASFPIVPAPEPAKAQAIDLSTEQDPVAASDVIDLSVPSSNAADSMMEIPASGGALVPSDGKNAAKKKKTRGFVVPRPGFDGAVAEILTGQRFVLTGVFPEVGGGCGLSMGKDKVKAWIESFGGRVTSAVSGKTNALICGQAPGASKVGKARSRNLPIFDLTELKRVCHGQATIETSQPARIEGFSSGYYGNTLKLSWTDHDDLRKPPAAAAPEASAAATGGAGAPESGGVPPSTASEGSACLCIKSGTLTANNDEESPSTVELDAATAPATKKKAASKKKAVLKKKAASKKKPVSKKTHKKKTPPAKRVHMRPQKLPAGGAHCPIDVDNDSSSTETNAAPAPPTRKMSAKKKTPETKENTAKNAPAEKNAPSTKRGRGRPKKNAAVAASCPIDVDNPATAGGALRPIDVDSSAPAQENATPKKIAAGNAIPKKVVPNKTPEKIRETTLEEAKEITPEKTSETTLEEDTEITPKKKMIAVKIVPVEEKAPETISESVTEIPPEKAPEKKIAPVEEKKPPAKRGRGRPKKAPVKEVTPPAKRDRGRPKTARVEEKAPPAKRGRGRPRKNGPGSVLCPIDVDKAASRANKATSNIIKKRKLAALPTNANRKKVKADSTKNPVSSTE